MYTSAHRAAVAAMLAASSPGCSGGVAGGASQDPSRVMTSAGVGQGRTGTDAAVAPAPAAPAAPAQPAPTTISPAPDAATARDTGAASSTDTSTVSPPSASRPPLPPGAWWDPAWKYRRRLVRAAPGAAIDGDFPLLVALTPRTFDAARALPEGADLRFVDDKGAVLPHEIDTWSPTERSLVWVRLPALHDLDAGIWLYYGNPTPSAPADSRAVWAPRSIVWHLSGHARDAGPVGISGTPSAANKTPGIFGDGKIGGGFVLDIATRSRVAFPSKSEFVSGLSRFTLSAWVFFKNFAVTDDKASSNDIATFAPDPAVYGGDQNGNHTVLSFGVSVMKNTLGVHVRPTPDEDDAATASTTETIRTGMWQHVAIAVDIPARSAQFFIDGQPAGVAKPLAKLKADAYPAKVQSVAGSLGSSPAGNYAHSNGFVDEVRLEPVARGAAWMKAAFDNMNAPEAFVGVSDEQPRP